MIQNGCTHAVIESSSHGLSEKTNRLGSVLFDAVAFMNVTQEHLEFHGTLEQYRDDKANLFKALKEEINNNHKSNDEFITAKALDDRFACYLMMKMIIEDMEVYNDTYYVFTIQEETGCRGSKVAANYIKPDIGLALDVTPAQDRSGDITGENTLCKGPAILISDTAIVAHEMVVSALIECAETNNIPYQRSCIYVGGNDGAAISLANDGIPAGLLGVVIRYCHTPFTMISKTDMDQTEQLTRAFLNYEFKTTYPIKIQ